MHKRNVCYVFMIRCTRSNVAVYGMNQNNQRSEWLGVANKDGVAVTHNWWWKGPVEIIAGNRRTTANVPPFAIYDTYLSTRHSLIRRFM